MGKTKVSEKLLCAKRMPELRHNICDGEFDIAKSEVVKWLISQPDIMQYIFNRVANNGSNPLIAYDPVTGKWQGADYAD